MPPSLSKPPTFTLFPASLPADIPAIVSVGILAFADDPIDHALFASADPAAHFKWRCERSEKRLLSEDGRKRARYVKLVLDREEGEEEVIVAYAGWWAPKEGGAEEEEEKKEEGVVEPPEGANVVLFDRVMKAIKESEERNLGKGWEGRWWYLQSLATHPSYRRLGAASRVLQWGIDQAEAQAKEQNPSRDDRNKIEGAYLESTPAGLSTYLKLGFEEVGSMEHDLGDGKEGYKFVCLMKRVG